MPLVEIHEADDAHAIGTYRNAVLSHWRAGAPTSQLRQMRTILGRHILRNRQGVVMVIRLVENLPIPESDGRDLISGMMKEYDASLLGWVLIIEGSGFRSAAARTAASTFRLMSRAGFEFKIASGVPEIAPWIATRMSVGEDTSTAEITAALREIAERVGTDALVPARRL
jgi:hypothetical protein